MVDSLGSNVSNIEGQERGKWREKADIIESEEQSGNV